MKALGRTQIISGVTLKLLLKIPNELNAANVLVLKCCRRHESLTLKVTISVEDACSLCVLQNLCQEL